MRVLHTWFSYTHTHLMALFPGLPGWAGTRKVKPIWILLKQETVSGSGISWVICKSAPCSRQITMPAPHYSVFYRPDALPAAQPTASKHWRDYTPIQLPVQIWVLTSFYVFVVMYLTHDVWDYRGHGYDLSNVCSSLNLSCMICWKGCPWVCACIVVAVAWLTGSRKLAAVAGSSSRVCSTQQLGQHATGTEGNCRPSTALRPNSPATAEGSRYFLTKCWIYVLYLFLRFCAFSALTLLVG